MTTTAPTAPAPTTAPVPVAPPPTDPSPVTTTAPTARLGAAAGSAGSGAGCRVAAVREPPGGRSRLPRGGLPPVRPGRPPRSPGSAAGPRDDRHLAGWCRWSRPGSLPGEPVTRRATRQGVLLVVVGVRHPVDVRRAPVSCRGGASPSWGVARPVPLVRTAHTTRGGLPPGQTAKIRRQRAAADCKETAAREAQNERLRPPVAASGYRPTGRPQPACPATDGTSRPAPTRPPARSRRCPGRARAPGGVSSTKQRFRRPFCDALAAGYEALLAGGGVMDGSMVDRT